MTNKLAYDGLNTAIQSIIARGEAVSTGNQDIDALTRVAMGLRGLPRPDFRARLLAELLPGAGARSSWRPVRWIGNLFASTRLGLHRVLLARGSSRVLVPSIVGVIVVAILAVAVLAQSGDNGASQVGGLGGGGDPPADLTAARDSLPVYPGTVDDSTNIYTGGSTLDALYFVNAAPADVSTFFEREMTQDGWKTLQAPTEIQLEPKGDKSPVISEWTYSAERDGVYATISARANHKDPKLGSTRIAIRVVLLNQ